MRRIVCAIAAMAVALGLTACGPTEVDQGSEDEDAGSILITPKGALGIDLGGGMYLDTATGEIGFGIPTG